MGLVTGPIASSAESASQAEVTALCKVSSQVARAHLCCGLWPKQGKALDKGAPARRRGHRPPCNLFPCLFFWDKETLLKAPTMRRGICSVVG